MSGRSAHVSAHGVFLGCIATINRGDRDTARTTPCHDRRLPRGGGVAGPGIQAGHPARPAHRGNGAPALRAAHTRIGGKGSARPQGARQRPADGGRRSEGRRRLDQRGRRQRRGVRRRPRGHGAAARGGVAGVAGGGAAWEAAAGEPAPTADRSACRCDRSDALARSRNRRHLGECDPHAHGAGARPR